jgi:hypothetical protein
LKKVCEKEESDPQFQILQRSQADSGLRRYFERRALMDCGMIKFKEQ